MASADPVDTAARHGVASFPATPVATARAVRRADAVVVGGGTVFKRLHRVSGRRRHALLANTAALVAGAHAAGVPVAMIGVGAGDLRGRAAGALSRWIARHVDLLVLRDEESAAVLAEAGAAAPFWIGADPVWYGVVAPPSGARPCGATDPAHPRVTVALSHLATGDMGRRSGGRRDGRTSPTRTISNLARALAGLDGRWDVRLQPWQTDGADDDRALAWSILGAVPGATIEDPPIGVADAAAAFKGTDVVVGMRFHSLVAAAIAGVRFVAVAHEPKLAAVARRLGQLAVPPQARAEVLTAAVLDAMHRPPPSPAAVAAEAGAAGTAFDLLELLLSPGAFADPADLRALPLSTGSGSW